VAVTYSPTTPVVGDDVTISTTIELIAEDPTHTTDAEHVRYVLDSVPPDSALATGILVDALGAETDTFTPDVSGEYVFTVHVSYEYAAPPSYDGADNGTTYQVLVSSSTVSVAVAASMDLVFAIPDGRGMTLRLGVANSVVATAELRDPLTREDELIAYDTSVAGLVSALVGQDVATMGPTLTDVVPELIDAYNAHRVQGGGVHANDDATNVSRPGIPYDHANCVAQLNAFAGVFYRHLTQASSATLPWHTADDTANVPITGSASTLAQAMLVYADLSRCYGRHLDQTSSRASHGAADATNTLATAAPLTALLSEVLYLWSSAAPTAPTGVEAGEIHLQSRYGFRAAS